MFIPSEITEGELTPYPSDPCHEWAPVKHQNVVLSSKNLHTSSSKKF
ncbi:hypothetical protein [Microbulbifer okhotskensis]